MGLSPDQQQILTDRLEQLRSLAGTSRTMAADAWRWEYLDTFCRHLTEFRRRGITKDLPSQLKHSGVEVRDEHGMLWDHLRGRQSVVHDVDTYMKELGGSWDTTAFWMSSQAGSSWSPAAQGVKYWFTGTRTVPRDRYYWREGVDYAKKQYDNALPILGKQLARDRGLDPSRMSDDQLRALGRERWEGSYGVLHAFNYELLQNVDFDRNRRADGIIELVRTEDSTVAHMHNLRIGEWKDFKRGALESTSIFQTVTVAGHELTMTEVPHHRVMGTYLMERQPGTSQSAFYGDGENGAVVMLEGLESFYGGTVYSGKSTRDFWKAYHAQKAQRR
jgi:hypothetical protein